MCLGNTSTYMSCIQKLQENQVNFLYLLLCDEKEKEKIYILVTHLQAFFGKNNQATTLK